jgi:hypothetical protein
MFFSLLLINHGFNLTIINPFNNNESRLLLDPLPIASAYALQLGDNNKIDSKIVNDSNETENNISIINEFEKNSNKTDVKKQQQEQERQEQEQNGMKNKAIQDFKNSSLQNPELSTNKTIAAVTTTKSPSSKGSFNFAAAGDWACTSKAKDTVKNIIDHDPELVLALGDLSYDSSAKCWLKIIKPIADKTKIVIGNHEAESSKKLKTYMKAFNLQKQYYSFNYQNVHFLALSTETSYDKGSKQYKFAEKDLEQYAGDSSIDWIVVFYHKNAYSSGGGLPDEKDFRNAYHPLFDKYHVDLALQGHHHAYERLYPITFNDDSKNKPIVYDKDKVKDSFTFDNPQGTIFLTVGTGGAESMKVAKGKPFSAAREDGKFGIINISLEKENNDKKILTGNFIDNKKKHKILDEFKIIKENK